MQNLTFHMSKKEESLFIRYNLQMDSTISKKYVITDTIIESDLGDEFFLLNLETGKYLKLNQSSRFIFYKIKDGLSEENIIHSLNDVYGLKPEEAKLGLNIFLKEATKFKIFV